MSARSFRLYGGKSRMRSPGYRTRPRRLRGPERLELRAAPGGAWQG